MGLNVFELIDEYTVYLDNREISPRTKSTYKTSLTQFRKWLSQQPDVPHEIAEIKPIHIERFFSHRKENGIGKGTRNQNYIHLNLFFKWAKKRHGKAAGKNPFKKIDPIVYKLPNREFPERDVLQKIVDSFDTSTFNGIRNRFAFVVLKETGIRASELLSLREEDFDLVHRILHIREGKGNKSRKVPFPEEVSIELLIYLEERNKQPKRASPNLLITRQGGMRYSTLLDAITRQCDLLQLDHLSPHGFRHAFVDYLKEKNVNDEAIMEIMGWDTYTMLLHYAKSKRAKRAVAEYTKKMLNPS